MAAETNLKEGKKRILMLRTQREEKKIAAG
jgi:hypothetical protein